MRLLLRAQRIGGRLARFTPWPRDLWYFGSTWSSVGAPRLKGAALGAERPTTAAADLVVALTPLAAGDLGAALARVLRDPSLELVFWLPERQSFADLDGRPVQLPAGDGATATTMILDSTGEPVAALRHDAALTHESELVQAVCSAAGIALESARQQVELRARLAEVTGSRARIVESAHELRERDYGVQRVTLEAQGAADTIAGLLREAPRSESARIAGAQELVSQLDTLSPGEERLAAVIGAAPVAVLEVDLDTRVVRWNTAAERIFGWREADVLGERVPFVPADREAEFQWLLERVRAGNAYTGFETVRRRRDGSRVDVEIAAAPVRDDSGTITSHMVVVTDISERTRHERELRESRAKVVEVGDAERRRLERNLHDGAQQRLVALSLELALLKQRFEGDPEARRAIDEARHELNESLQELRELARGIHPAIVTAHGLEVAVESLAARSPVPVEVVVELDGGVSETCQVAAYYVVSESLTNMAKYAGAAAATIEIRSSETHLVVEVRDDGGGGADATAGSGLRGLADRMESVGGRLQVWSPAGGGTRIRAELPIAP